MLERIIGV